MTDRAVPDRDTLRRVIFPLQRPDWQVHSPAAAPTPDGKWARLQRHPDGGVR